MMQTDKLRKLGGLPLKYKVIFYFNKLELLLNQPLARISLVLRINNERFESSNRPKASKETLLNEEMMMNVIIFEGFEETCLETIAHCDVFFIQSKSSRIIGTFDLDLGLLANKAKRQIAHQECFIELEKSPEYKGKISFAVKIEFLEIEKEENLPKKLRGKSNTPSRCDIHEVSKESSIDYSASIRTPNKLKRSTTPTPTMNNHNLIKSEIQQSKTKEFDLESTDYQIETVSPLRKQETGINSSNIRDKNELEKSEENRNDFDYLEVTQEKRRATFGIKTNEKIDQKIIKEQENTVYLNKNQQQKEFQSLLKTKTELEDKYSLIQSEKMSLETKNQSLNLQNSQLRNFQLQIQKDLEIKSQEIQMKSSRISELEEYLSSKEKEIKRLEILLNGQKGELDSLKKEISFLENNDSEKKDEEIEFYKDKLKILELETDYKGKEYEKSLMQKKEELSLLKSNISDLLIKNSLLENQIEEEHQNYQKEKIKMKETMKNLEEHRDNLIKQLSNKNLKITELEENINDLQTKYIKSKENIGQMVNLIFERENPQLMENVEGFLESRKQSFNYESTQF